MLFLTTLIVAAFLCCLVTGFLFAFAVVAMPGIRRLDDGTFIRAFQVMDGVIQNNPPLFMLLWVGSVVALLAAMLLGFGRLEGAEQALLIAATLVYLLGVQLPTVGVNIPLNNRLQTLDVNTMDADDLGTAREAFEARWNRWNVLRTALAGVASILLLVVLATV